MPNYPRGPLSRVYQKAKDTILQRIDNQEINVALNRRVVPEDFPLPAKLLAIPRSRKNLEIEITPFTEKGRTGKYGKKSA